MVIALSLCGIGLVYLSSAAPSTSFVVRQAVFLFAGLVAFSAMYTVHYSNWTRYAWVLYAAGIASLIAVAIIGTRVNGAKSWFSIGSIRIQPSEFMKIATLLFLARHLSIGDGAKKFSGLLTASALVGVPMLMITVQPDFGSALAFVPMAAGAVWIAGVKKRFVAAALLIGLLTASFGYAFLLKDYQKQRIEAWLNPDAFSKTTAYQTAQARIAIGSGRLSGKGLNQGTHHKLKYLPERHTDMIFAVVSEEGGFVMSGLTLTLFFALFLYGILTAYRTRDPAGRMIAVLAASLLTGQAIINIGVCNGLVPVTGIALPFLSYGGSSLLSSWMAVGLLANVASRRKVWLGADGVSV
ncbi:MAG: FtsW/RodA/SpoVE family cell cycle protein [Planctomycetota bacterium]